MLLPSDVARLVLGYLQEERLCATTQAFIHECPNLKEYAEHSTEDGTIPACVFSVFGKGLTTILNEYVAVKTKESCHEVPAVMTSLWKKLDHTLNQIKSLQNSPAISANQRIRSRIGVANMARQRVLTVASAGAVICSSVSETSSIISPAQISHSMLGHSTPVSYTAAQTRPATGSGTHPQIHDGSRLLNTPRDSPIQIIVSEQRLNPGPMSPGRRKWDTPRKRGGAQSGSSTPSRCAMTVSTPNAEPQPEDGDGNFPQLVIQNARDKILGDRSLQEKLAENINKILANEPMPQTSKAPSTTVEADQSIDEILGLQGEIHMSDDAIHDILEQTESDPAFHALFELFDYNKTRFPDGELGDGDISSSPAEGDPAGPSSTVGPLPSDDPVAAHRDAKASDTTPMTVKARAGQEPRTRKSTAPTLLKKITLGPSGRASRIENSSAKLLVSHADHQNVTSAAVDSNRKEKPSLFNSSAFVTPMDIDEPLNTPPPPLDCMTIQEPATKDSMSVAIFPSESSILPSTVFNVPEATSNIVKGQEHIQGSKVQFGTAPSAFLFPLQVELNNTPTLTADLPHMSLSSSGRDTQPEATVSVAPEPASYTSPSSSATVTAVPASPSSAPPSASTSATLTATPASSSPVSPASSSSCAPVDAAPGPPTANNTTPSKAAANSSDIVSLEIIISDNQDEDFSTNTPLNQAISSISGDNIPTIYLSSPPKTSGVPGTPKATLDEAAQAVSCLQSSEAFASPLSCKAGALVTSPLTGTAQPQQNFIIQLPLNTANPALQGATASYFLVTEPNITDAQARQVLLSAGVSRGPPLPTNSYGVTTPPRSRGSSTGPTLILPSPVKPMLLPVSVMGPNTLGKVQVVSNKLVAMPNPVPVQQSDIVKPKTPTMAIQQCSPAGTEQHLVGKLVQTVLAEDTDQLDTAKGPSHRRILRFESSAEVQPQTAKTTRSSKSTATNASSPRSVQQTEKDDKESVTRTKPTILGGNKPRRRIETVRCSKDTKTGGSFMEAEKSIPPQQHQKDPFKKNSRKQDCSNHSEESQSASTSSVDAPQPETLKKKKSESGWRSKSIDVIHNHDKDSDAVRAKDSHASKSSDSALKSESRKEKDESSKKETAEKAAGKSREGRTEKRTPTQDVPNVTANKENEMKGSLQEPQQESTPSSSALRDFSPPVVTQPASNPQAKATKASSKTSSLAKQAAEMLQDIQGLNSPSSPVKKPGAGSSDHGLPRTPGTSRAQEESADRVRTPSRQRKANGEGTPKHLIPPNTPDVPTSSPASEAGSENSINMAAHTLMILSRAAIARTGTPLKDSLRQEEVGEKSATSSKNSKKRKQPSPAASPRAKKESKQSPSQKTDRERKKLVDCFPHDLDVDKFLSSLHYDE